MLLLKEIETKAANKRRHWNSPAATQTRSLQAKSKGKMQFKMALMMKGPSPILYSIKRQFTQRSNLTAAIAKISRSKKTLID